MALYIGLMSGTSMDGIDAALVEMSADTLDLKCYLERPYPSDVRARLALATEQNPRVGLRELGALDADVGRAFAAAAHDLMAAGGAAADEIAAIGSHGQTLLHSPDSDPAFTLQIGDPATIAVATGITTVADFRSMDMAAGGQGAPLAPAFHAFAFRSDDEDRVVVNLGGIANTTMLAADPAVPVTAFDTGPANCLLDEWAKRARQVPFDENGRWASGGRVVPELLAAMQDDPYFHRSPPKSTGRDLFNGAWLDRFEPRRHAPADVQATLSELTARTVADAVAGSGLRRARVLVCGGGAANGHLMNRLAALLPESTVTSTAELGIAPERIEACAFAWLAARRVDGLPSNLPSVTGARHPVSLGAVYRPAPVARARSRPGP